MGILNFIQEFLDPEYCAREKKFRQELKDEGKQLRKKAEEKMAKMKCSKGGYCNFILEEKTSKHLPGWYDEITGHYKCAKCGEKRDEIIQYPN